MSFPGTVTAPSFWLNGNQQAYSDLAGLVPVSSGRIRRINEPAPLAGAWTAPTDDERPLRDSASSIGFEPQGPAGGYQLTRSNPGGIYWDSCTVVVGFLARDHSFAGPLMGLICDDAGGLGIRIGSNTVSPNTASGLFNSGLIVAPGKYNVIAVTYTPTGVSVKLDADGVVTTASWAISIPHTAAAGWRVGTQGVGYEYGSMTQAIGWGGALSGADRDDVMAYVKAQAYPAAYPDNKVLLATVGNSITRSTATEYDKCYVFRTLQSVRDAGYLAEVCNVAVGGTGVSKLRDPINGALPPNGNNLFLRACAFYSPTRVANVMIIALGTNDLANNNPVEFVLYGTGSPNNAEGTSPFPGSGLLPTIAAAVAMGWKPVVIVPGPRSDNPSFQSTYNARRAQVCDALVANAAAYGYKVVDTRGIVGFGQDGDSDNATTYSSDKVHPLAPGHALLAPFVSAKVLEWLSAPVVITPAGVHGELTIQRLLDWESEDAIYLFSLANSEVVSVSAPGSGDVVTVDGEAVTVDGEPVTVAA